MFKVGEGSERTILLGAVVIGACIGAYFLGKQACESCAKSESLYGYNLPYGVPSDIANDRKLNQYVHAQHFDQFPIIDSRPTRPRQLRR